MSSFIGNRGAKILGLLRGEDLKNKEDRNKPWLFVDGNIWPTVDYDCSTFFNSIDRRTISMLRSSLLIDENAREYHQLLSMLNETGQHHTEEDVQLLKECISLGTNEQASPNNNNNNSNENVSPESFNEGMQEVLHQCNESELELELPVIDTEIVCNKAEDAHNIDIDFSPESCITDASNIEQKNHETKKGRKRKASQENWIANKAKKLRNTGKKYVSKNSLVVRNARSVKPGCDNKCSYQCSLKFNSEDRLRLFNNYWSIEDLTRKREYLIRHMDEIIIPNEKSEKSSDTTAHLLSEPNLAVAQQTENEQEEKKPSKAKKERKRIYNNMYFLEKEGQKRRVCKQFFMATLDINHKVITTCRKKKLAGLVVEDFRGKHGNHKNCEEIKDRMRAHILSIPRVESHYLRQQTTREFIEGGKSISGIYRDFKEKCLSNNEKCGSFTLFNKVFDEFNISFFTPKKDQCEVCTAFNNSDKSDQTAIDENLQHIADKEISRSEKENDKLHTSEDVIVCTFDLQAALPTPKGEVSVFYYKSKLSTYNLTIYELKSKQGICNVWHEGEAKRGSNEIATTVYKYMEKKVSALNKDLEFIFYSDNCCGQNKNKYILIMYMYALNTMSNIKSITHKFLVKGHTQNEGDTVHSTIEREVKRAQKAGPIYVPSQYSQIMRTSKKTPPLYRVEDFHYSEFIDFKDLARLLGDNFNTNIDNESFHFNDVRVLKVTQEDPFVFYYKLNFKDEYKKVDIFQGKPKKKTRSTLEISIDDKRSILQNWGKKAAYDSPCGISKRKKDDLMSLVTSNVVPLAYHDFYNDLLVQ